MTTLTVVGNSQVSTISRQVWERQAGETARQFELFQLYIGLGTGRSQAKVAERIGRSRQYVGTVSAKQDWVARADAWEHEQEREFFAGLKADRRDAMKRHANIASAMMGVVAAQLRAIQNQAEQGKLTANELARWVEVATKVEMLALGGATERIEGDVGGLSSLVADLELAKRIREDPDATEDALALLDRVARIPLGEDEAI